MEVSDEIVEERVVSGPVWPLSVAQGEVVKAWNCQVESGYGTTTVTGNCDTFCSDGFGWCTDYCNDDLPQLIYQQTQQEAFCWLHQFQCDEFEWPAEFTCECDCELS